MFRINSTIDGNVKATSYTDDLATASDLLAYHEAQAGNRLTGKGGTLVITVIDTSKSLSVYNTGDIIYVTEVTITRTGRL